jgi:pimeloyl-ACP methyl ester carboxylesterase
MLQAVRQCREKLLRQGIDPADYNTDESASDIEDFRRLLKIQSINLMGISYSGGLMMAVLQKYPEHIRSLILDAPLPEFVNIDEDELTNFNEALTEVLTANDTTLSSRFQSYLSSLGENTMTIPYQLGDGSRVELSYGRPEILSVIHSKLEDYDGVQNLTEIVRDMMGDNASFT